MWTSAAHGMLFGPAALIFPLIITMPLHQHIKWKAKRRGADVDICRPRNDTSVSFAGSPDAGHNHAGGSRTAPTVESEIQGSKPKPVGRLIGAFKTISTRQINLIRGVPGETVWQRGFYEHIIRNESDLENIRQYIESNPVKWEYDKYCPNRR